ncbi:helix-turn-helix domain-containing protein [Bacillus infantis]|uniref:helix-turn-helix domain-containing protein n=1 Tax=Bacillus infantis TaxID=324767 RepID=UPI003CF76CF1
MKFGAVLQACRERAGLSQEELAHQLNRTQSCVSKYEKDRKIPDMHTFLQWIQATNTPEIAVAFLYGMDGINLIQQLLPLVGSLVCWF